LACSSSTFSIASGDRSGELGVDLVEPGQKRANRRDALFDVAEHGLRRVELRFLREVSNGVAGRERRLALEVLLQARHDLEERRLPRAVRADDADLRAVEERQPDVLKDDGVGRIDLPEPLHRVDELRQVPSGC
jgi:hypothetical protein